MEYIVKNIEFIKDSKSIVATVEVTIPLVLKIDGAYQDTQQPCPSDFDNKN